METEFVKTIAEKIAARVQEIVVVHPGGPVGQMGRVLRWLLVGTGLAMRRPRKTAKAARKTANAPTARSAAAGFAAPTTPAATGLVKRPTVKTAIPARWIVLVRPVNNAKAANARRSRLVETEAAKPRVLRTARPVHRTVVAQVERSASASLVAS